MEIKAQIKNTLVLLAGIYVCYILQTSIFSHFKLAGVAPNILLILVSAIGFMKGSTKGLLCGFLCGLLLDGVFCFYTGTMAAIYMIVGYINGLFKRMFFSDDLKLPMGLIAMSDIIYGCIVYFILFLFRQRYDFEFYFFSIMIPEMLYTVIVGVFVYFVILKVDSFLNDSDFKRKMVKK